MIANTNHQRMNVNQQKPTRLYDLFVLFGMDERPRAIKEEVRGLIA